VPIATGADFSEIHERMQWYVEQEIIPCCATVVLEGTRVVDSRTCGFMDLDSRRPLRSDAIFRMYSNTKMVTSAAAMLLYEAGHFDLDGPVAEIIPAFANMQVLKPGAQTARDTEPARSPITLRQLLSHSAGLSYGFMEPESLIDKTYTENKIGIGPNAKRTLEELCDLLAAMPLAYQPGTSWRYGFATDVVARVVEVLANQRFDEFLRERVFEPLGMVDTDFYVPAHKQERLITEYVSVNVMRPRDGGLIKTDDPATSFYLKQRPMLSGGGGLVSTVADYLSFLRMIICGGEWQGTRLLQPETVALMRSNQLGQGITVRFPFWRMPDTVFGLGFAVKQSPARDEPELAIDEYHWGGMAGTHTWMSPRADIAGMCMTQLNPGFWHRFSHDFKRMVYERATQASG
jgi:CubicO group peptidase (beta-lactamase class C family)